MGCRYKLMPYALFSQGSKISRSFSTEEEVWQHAKQSGLLVDVNGTDNRVEHVLDQDYAIEPCAKDPSPKENPNATDFELPEPKDV